MQMTTPRAQHDRVSEALADADRTQRSKDAHATALRKLKTAAGVAAHSGATWEEIREMVEAGVAETVNESAGQMAVLAANARARVHNGDDSM